MLDLEEQKLKELKQEVTACQAEFSERAELSMQPGHGMAAFVGRMNSAIAVQKNEILQRQSGYDNIRLEKMIHTQRINGLRKLEEDEWAEFETEQNRKQQNELLDVVLRSQLFS
jgi:flagellar biosynthesis chaperone FliJ